MGSYSDEEDNRRIYLVSSALSPEEYRHYPKWFAELVPPGHLTLTLDDMLVFADRFSVTEQDKWKIFDVFESPLSTLEKGEFYAFVRLIGHVLNGKTPSRALVFQQAPVAKILQEPVIVSQPDVTVSPSASQRSSLTVPPSTIPSPSNTGMGLPISSVLDGARVNPFRRHPDRKNRGSSESRNSAESMTRITSAEKSEMKPSARGTEQSANDIHAVDAFTQMLLGQNSDATPRKSSDSAVSDRSTLNQIVIAEIKQDDPVFDMSDIESSSSSSEVDEDEAIDEESTSTAKNTTMDDSISLAGLGMSDAQQPSLHTIESQHYLVMPKERQSNPTPRKSLEADYSKRPAPPPPRPRKGAHGAQSSVSLSSPVVITSPATSSEPITAPLTLFSSSRSSSSSSLPKSLSAPGPPPPLISQTENKRTASGGVSPSWSSTSSFASTRQSSSTSDVPAHATVDDVDFEAAFDEQHLFPAVGSPPETRVNPPQTAPPSQKSHVPPPPPPSRRRVGHSRDQSTSAATTQGHYPHPPPPPPPPPSATLHYLNNRTSATTTIPSSNAASVDESAVPDLLADLTALQREVDAVRAQHMGEK
ncbi:hypothetical protein POJ06DRAFT_275553 [Lipomyces tetrasporus]|uniref:EH domain-containing protein n=1 Tax=Lipomyces tetrasporus TaxID=54092 RepID=A0AAD7QS30_9ASCO|nr:uncharacterized protein POJ06DRAFT_275553 [Lipomyces tetrasporus]KAJ8100467.1 hypothetical protein POJ06DRAFT_275553 [Lipomyces tetrasporus]